MIRTLHRWPGLLALALVTVLAVSGTALSVFPTAERLSAPQAEADLTVAELAAKVQSVHPGVEQIRRAPSGRITAFWFDNGTPGSAVIDPATGKGIAKGYGVDRLAGTLRGFGVTTCLVGIDGEMRASGLRPDGKLWTVAIEAPDPERRAPYSILTLENAAVATSGDYRHHVTVQGQRLSHTMDPATGGPLRSPPASVTVVARTCAEADAWATALMVLGPKAGAELAVRLGLDALFLMRGACGIRVHAAGTLFRAAGAIG